MTSIVWEESDHVIGKHVLLQTKDDDEIGTSVEDREFVKLMSGSFQKNLHGKCLKRAMQIQLLH